MRNGLKTKPASASERSSLPSERTCCRYTGMYITNPGCDACMPRNGSPASTTLAVIAASAVSRARSIAARRAGSENMSKPMTRTLRAVKGSLKTMGKYSGRSPDGRIS